MCFCRCQKYDKFRARFYCIVVHVIFVIPGKVAIKDLCKSDTTDFVLDFIVLFRNEFNIKFNIKY